MLTLDTTQWLDSSCGLPVVEETIGWPVVVCGRDVHGPQRIKSLTMILNPWWSLLDLSPPFLGQSWPVNQLRLLSASTESCVYHLLLNVKAACGWMYDVCDSLDGNTMITCWSCSWSPTLQLMLWACVELTQLTLKKAGPAEHDHKPFLLVLLVVLKLAMASHYF